MKAGLSNPVVLSVLAAVAAYANARIDPKSGTSAGPSSRLSRSGRAMRPNSGNRSAARTRPTRLASSTAITLNSAIE